ncbi:hypothetical protein A2U01_0056440, partial [Trifolium medium]|nr:hypothetical protein [Trifolium medium]
PWPTQHKRWIKRWKRHQEMTKSKCEVKKPTSIKEQRRRKRQLEAVREWIRTRHIVVIPTRGSEPYCGHPFCKRSHKVITEDEPVRTYPL